MAQDPKNLHALAREYHCGRKTIRGIIANGLTSSNGKVSSSANEKLVSLTSDQPRTLEEAIAAANVTNEWEVERWQTSSWTVILKGGTEKVAFRTLLKLKRRVLSPVVMAGFESLIARLETRDPPVIVTECPPVTDGSLAVLRLADLHAGRLHHEDETKWSLTVWSKVVRNAISDLVALIGCHQPISKVLIVSGDDLLNADSERSMTTSETYVTSCASMSRVTDVCIEFLIWCVEYCSSHLARNIEVIYIPGNHDRQLGHMCMKVVKAYFRTMSDIVVDDSLSPRKARLHKQCLLAFEHGDMISSPAKIASTLPLLYPVEWGASKYRSVQLGHVHRSRVLRPSLEFVDGVVVKYLPSIAPPDMWSNNHCYQGEEAATASLYNDNSEVASFTVRARE